MQDVGFLVNRPQQLPVVIRFPCGVYGSPKQGQCLVVLLEFPIDETQQKLRLSLHGIITNCFGGIEGLHGPTGTLLEPPQIQQAPGNAVEVPRSLELIAPLPTLGQGLLKHHDGLAALILFLKESCLGLENPHALDTDDVGMRLDDGSSLGEGFQAVLDLASLPLDQRKSAKGTNLINGIGKGKRRPPNRLELGFGGILPGSSLKEKIHIVARGAGKRRS